jgi:hypothetical protein
MCKGDPFLKNKRPRREADETSSSSVEFKRISVATYSLSLLSYGLMSDKFTRILAFTVFTSNILTLQQNCSIQHTFTLHSNTYRPTQGHAVAQMVEALRYNAEGRDFDFQWCKWKFFIGTILLIALWPLSRLSL